MEEDENIADLSPDDKYKQISSHIRLCLKLLVPTSQIVYLCKLIEISTMC